MAEKLQQSLEKNTSNRRKLFAVQQGIAILMWVELATAYFSVIVHIPATYSFSQAFPVRFSVVLGLVFIAFIASSWFLYSSFHQVQSLHRAVRLDERDLSEVVELLREIEPVVAKEENLSVLERVRLRIRLSRFGVGSSQMDHTGASLRELTGDFPSPKGRVDQELMKPL